MVVLLLSFEIFWSMGGRRSTREPGILSKNMEVNGDHLCNYNSKKIQLTGCGWEGLTDFSNHNEPIDDSCYDKVTPSVSGIISR